MVDVWSSSTKHRAASASVWCKKMTVTEHIQFLANIKGLYERLSYDDAEASIMQSIEDVALLKKRDTYSKDLSGGMKRKLSLAIAFCGDSKVVFLEELMVKVTVTVTVTGRALRSLLCWIWRLPSVRSEGGIIRWILWLGRLCIMKSECYLWVAVAPSLSYQKALTHLPPVERIYLITVSTTYRLFRKRYDRLHVREPVGQLADKCKRWLCNNGSISE